MFPPRLVAGHRAFRANRFRREKSRYAELAAAQSPEIMVIGCCDSRVPPETIFDAAPGEIFVLRNVANLVPPLESGGKYHGTSSAIEFAVQALQVRHIVVMGHAGCGGIRAFANQAAPLSPGDFIGKWMGLIAPAAERCGFAEATPDSLKRLELAVVELSLSNLMTFPWLRARVERGELHLHGSHFGIAEGVLLVRDPATAEFAPLPGATRSAGGE